MAKSPNQKLKILYLLKILLEKTDEENRMTINEMIEELSKYDITAERKSIYDDLEALRVYGIDIVCRKGKTTTYFVAQRMFELPEVKLLIDIVQSSRFITHRKSNELIRKIESLASIYQAKNLQRQVYVINRSKSMNERIYINVDLIHTAINEKKQIAFRYFDYNLQKKKQFRNDGQLYRVSPFTMSWTDENYYLISHYPKNLELTHFRVDRMIDIELLDVPCIPLHAVTGEANLDIARYSKKIFSMFGGVEESVTLEFDNNLVNVAIDRFGQDISIEIVDDQHFCIRVKVAVSSTFLAWIFQFGNKVKIISPEPVVCKYKQMLMEIRQQYE